MGAGVAGDKTEMVLEGVDEAEVEIGLLYAHNKFSANVYFMTKEEGGRSVPIFAGYRPHIYIRTVVVLGTLTDLETEMVMPGDHVRLHVKLSRDVPCKEGMRFAVKEQDKTVGAGVIESIID